MRHHFEASTPPAPRQSERGQRGAVIARLRRSDLGPRSCSSSDSFAGRMPIRSARRWRRCAGHVETRWRSGGRRDCSRESHTDCASLVRPQRAYDLVMPPAGLSAGVRSRRRPRAPPARSRPFSRVMARQRSGRWPAPFWSPAPTTRGRVPPQRPKGRRRPDSPGRWGRTCPARTTPPDPRPQRGTPPKNRLRPPVCADVLQLIGCEKAHPAQGGSHDPRDQHQRDHRLDPVQQAGQKAQPGTAHGRSGHCRRDGPPHTIRPPTRCSCHVTTCPP